MLDPKPERRPSAAELAAGPDGTMVMPTRRGRRAWLLPAVAAAIVLFGVVGAALIRSGSNADREAAAAAVEIITTPPACDPLPYQPCGSPEPAPFTDGVECTDGHADYDSQAANGCEAAPDGLGDGSELTDRIDANLVPADDVDTFVTRVSDRSQLLCDGQFRLTLTAPAAHTVKLVVRAPNGDVIGQMTSADGISDELAFNERSCGGDDSKTLTLEVTGVGTDRTAESYTITRSGSF
jgi:hypothetical protein